MRGQISLNNFFQSVAFSNPGKALDMQQDVATVAVYAMAADKTPAQDAAERLRRAAEDLPVIQTRVLEHALEDLGF